MNLMVGDWVSCDGTISKVYGVDAGGLLSLLVDDLPPELTTVGAVEGIPITPEILEKNGFVYLKDVHCYYDLNIDLHPMKFGKYAPYRIGKTTMFINDVHELQHVFHLADVKKEIKL